MTKSGIDVNDARSLEQSVVNLIELVRVAIAEYDASPASKSIQLPQWQTPAPWRDTVLSNLDRALNEVRAAKSSLAAPDPMPLTLAAASLAGLGKDLEFDTCWMTKSAADGIKVALEELVLVADRIYRTGYAELARMGRV